MDKLPPLHDRYAIAATITKFEDTFAVVTIADGQTVRWPIKELPENCAIGSQVRLVLTTTQSDEEERKRLAKTILNEVLKSAGQDQG